MHPPPTLGLTSPGLQRFDQCSEGPGPDGQWSELGVDSIGHLVPRDAFEGQLHSVFARSCNVALGGLLLNLCAPVDGHERGPATLRLAARPALPLQRLFEPGEPFVCRGGIARTQRARINLRRASVWRPPRSAAAGDNNIIARNLRLARASLGARRCERAGILDREAAATAAALGQACGAFDLARAPALAERLIGWGEGLTPAGDDYLVGLLAGLDLVMCGDARRRALRDALAAAIDAASWRTTPVAAHCLRLAARGHCGEALCLLGNALLSEPRPDALRSALQRVLSIGASSGADTVAGLLAGVSAWPAYADQPS
jgi:hypothetical protein